MKPNLTVFLMLARSDQVAAVKATRKERGSGRRITNQVINKLAPVAMTSY